MTEEFRPLSNFPLYEISPRGVVRNRENKRPLKKYNNGTVVMLACPNMPKRRTRRTINSLLWENFGTIKSSSRPKNSPVILQRNGRRLHFDTKAQAAQFLAEKYFYSINYMERFLAQKKPVIFDWQVTYLASEDNIHLPAIQKLNTLAKQQRKAHRDALHRQAERSRH